MEVVDFIHTVEVAVDADFKAGISDETYYEMLLQDLLDQYGIVGKISFKDFPKQEYSRVLLNGRNWKGWRSKNKSHDWRIGMATHCILKEDSFDYAVPMNRMLQDKDGVTLFNIADLKEHPKDWEQYIFKS
jgi:hypothetical protein